MTNSYSSKNVYRVSLLPLYGDISRCSADLAVLTSNRYLRSCTRLVDILVDVRTYVFVGVDFWRCQFYLGTIIFVVQMTFLNF